MASDGCILYMVLQLNKPSSRNIMPSAFDPENELVGFFFLNFKNQLEKELAPFLV